ncbi:hypothetical protein [Streptomyces sp. ME19-01-6]|uniref:hypothetical protein n=1 Tax=Streptomyces sp. ME19-01-6 TaxID=3028686 RepID=UPI0029A5C7FE|nr:hypothetical protein [Streptomyces sp. ME19-01-6]MDX3224610.1 hypothetical protein [Streptomyces sp. ME19-01-6]
MWRPKAKANTKDGLGKVEEVLLPLLEDLAEKKPEDLAVILGEDLNRLIKLIGRIYSQVQLACNLLSKAQGIQRVMAEEFNKTVAEVEQEATKKKGEAEAESEGQEVKADGEGKPVVKKAVAKSAAPRSRTAVGAAAKSPARKAPARKKAEQSRYLARRR